MDNPSLYEPGYLELAARDDNRHEAIIEMGRLFPSAPWADNTIFDTHPDFVDHSELWKHTFWVVTFCEFHFLFPTDDNPNTFYDILFRKVRFEDRLTLGYRAELYWFDGMTRAAASRMVFCGTVCTSEEKALQTLEWTAMERLLGSDFIYHSVAPWSRWMFDESDFEDHENNNRAEGSGNDGDEQDHDHRHNDDEYDE